MSLTALIAELFVGGILCVMWVFLVLAAFFDVQPVLAFVKDNQLIGTLVCSVLAYAVGVILDRVWDWVLGSLSAEIERGHFKEKEKVRQARQRIFGKDKDGAEFVDYVRSRMRIARAVLCNAILITDAGLLYYSRRTTDPSPEFVITISLIGLLLALAAFGALKGLTHAYYKALKVFIGEHGDTAGEKESGQAPAPAPPHVISPATSGATSTGRVAQL